MADLRPSLLSNELQAPRGFVHTDVPGSGAGLGSHKFNLAVLGYMRDSLAPSSGISANGLSLPVQIPNSAAFDLGVDDFTIYMKSLLGSWTPGATVVLWDKVAANLGPRLSVLSTGFLRFQLGNGSDLTTYQFDSTEKISDAVAANRPAHIVAAVDRVNGSLAFYVNGLQLGTAVSIAAAAAQTATSTAPIRLHSNGSTHHSGVILGGFAPVYNTCLSAALVLTTYLRGGVPPSNYMFMPASAVPLVSDTFAAGVSPWAAYSPVSITHDALNAELDFAGWTVGNEFYRDGVGGFFQQSQRYRCRLVLANMSAPTGNFVLRTNSTQTPLISQRALVNATFVMEFDGTTAMNTNDNALALVRVSGTGGSSGSIQSFSMTRVGALCFYGISENAGLQLLDGTVNRRHALRSVSDVAWLTPQPNQVRLRGASDGTTTAQQIGGGTLIPANSQLVRIRARAQAGTPSITLGTSSGGSQIVASVALSTTWKNLTIALTDGLIATASAVWITASAANVVEIDAAYETLSA